MADQTVAPPTAWADWDQSDIEEHVRMQQRYARFKYPPFNDWQWAINALQAELDEFKASVVRGEPDLLELFGLSATAHLVIKEMSKHDVRVS